MKNTDTQDICFLTNLGQYMDAAFEHGEAWDKICHSAIKVLRNRYDLNTCQATKAMHLATRLARSTSQEESDDLVWKYIITSEAINQANDIYMRALSDTQYDVSSQYV